MPGLSVPTTARLPSSLRVDPANPIVSKTLSRLSRPALLSLALDWLDENNLPLAAPYLRGGRDEEEDEDEDEGDFHPPARSLAALQHLYADMQARKGSKREVLDRITEGDWRHGLSLYQLAMADLQYLYDHPTSQKWSAYRITPLKPLKDPNSADGEEAPEVDKESLVVPRFHPSTFLRALQAQVLPDVKAHYQLDRHRTLGLLILRIFIIDSPYNTSLGLPSSSRRGAAAGAGVGTATTFDSSRTVYVAFPDASPHVFISKPQAGAGAGASGGGGGGAAESKSLRTLILEGVPKALSRPGQRFTLKSTNLVTRNLAEMIERRGPARTNCAGGGWSIYADEKKKESPLDTVLPLRPLAPANPEDGGEDDRRKRQATKRALSPAAERDERAVKRAMLVARGRFGDSAKVKDGRGVERVDIVIEDAFPFEEGGEATLSARPDEQGEDDERRPWEPSRGRLSAAGGRKSQIHKDLDENEDEEEDDDDDEEEEDRTGDGRKGKAKEASTTTTGARQQQAKRPKRRPEPADAWRPNVRLTFHGPHVFAGIRQLVELGIIDGERMPGWMTGDEGVTIGAVRHGRIRGYKGSGML